jgi:hypothetical protein
MATLATLASVSKLVPTITVVGLFDFIFIAKQLRDDVLLAQPAEESEDDAPEILPPTMTRLLASACSIQFQEVEMLWAELRHLIWCKQDFPTHNLSEMIHNHGHGLGFTADTLYPPRHSCIQPACPRRRKGLLLKKTYHQKAVLYTLDRGAVPAYAVSLYCEGALFSCHVL